MCEALLECTNTLGNFEFVWSPLGGTRTEELNTETELKKLKGLKFMFTPLGPFFKGTGVGCIRTVCAH